MSPNIRRSVSFAVSIGAAAAATALFLYGCDSKRTAELPLSISASESSFGTNMEIISHSATPILIRRVTANDRVGVPGCDLNPALNGKGEYRDDANFTPTTLHEGESLGVTFMGMYPCGDHIVKVTIETDQGAGDFDIH